MLRVLLVKFVEVGTWQGYANSHIEKLHAYSEYCFQFCVLGHIRFSEAGRLCVSRCSVGFGCK